MCLKLWLLELFSLTSAKRTTDFRRLSHRPKTNLQEREREKEKKGFGFSKWAWWDQTEWFGVMLQGVGSQKTTGFTVCVCGDHIVNTTQPIKADQQSASRCETATGPETLRVSQQLNDPGLGAHLFRYHSGALGKEAGSFHADLLISGGSWLLAPWIHHRVQNLPDDLNDAKPLPQETGSVSDRPSNLHTPALQGAH